jgi:hypothetical protein
MFYIGLDCHGKWTTVAGSFLLECVNCFRLLSRISCVP